MNPTRSGTVDHRNPIYLLLADESAEGKVRAVELSINSETPTQKWTGFVRISFDSDIAIQRVEGDGVYESANRAETFAGRMLAPFWQYWTQNGLPDKEPDIALHVDESRRTKGPSADAVVTVAAVLAVIDEIVRIRPELRSPLLGKRWPPFAATGELADDCTIKRVGRVPEKVKAALEAFDAHPAGDKAVVFIPTANLDDFQGEFADLPTDPRVVAVKHLQDLLDELSARSGWLRQRTTDGLQPLRAPIIGNPYAGLRAFTQANRAVFFGRDDQIGEVLGRLPSEVPSRLPGVLIVGPSGSGKSSLMLAGVLGALMHGPYKKQYDFTRSAGLPAWRAPRGGLEGSALCDSLRDHFQTWLPQTRLTATSLPALADEAAGALTQDLREGKRHVLAIDQMEELFSGPDSVVARPEELRKLEDFNQLLIKLQGVGVWVLGTARSDVGDQLKKFDRVFAADQRVKLTLLSQGDAAGKFLREVIERPAKLAGVEIEHGLPETLIADAQHDARLLPLLQLTLDKLYEAAAEAAAKVKAEAEANGKFITPPILLTNVLYEKINRIAGAIDTTTSALLSEADRRGQSDLLLGALSRLAFWDEVGETFRRARMARGDFRPDEQALLEAWVDARLLVKVDDVYEVAHEAVLNNFHRFGEWTKAEGRRQLMDWRRSTLLRRFRSWRQYITLAQQGTVNQSLLSEESIEGAPTSLFNQYVLSSDEIDYVERSRKWLEEKARKELEIESDRKEKLALKNKWLKRQSAALIGVLVFLAGALWWVLGLARENAAQRWAFESVNEENSALQPNSDSLLKALLAYRVTSDTWITQHALVKVAQAADRIPDKLPASTAEGAAPTSGVIETLDGPERPLEARRAGNELATLRQNATSKFSGIAISPDTNFVVSWAEGGSMQVWDRASGRSIGQKLSYRLGEILSATSWGNGSRLISAGSDGTVFVWDTATGQPIGAPLLSRHPKAVTSVAISRDSRWIAAGSADGAIFLWPSDTLLPQAKHLAVGNAAGIQVVAFSTNGQLLVSGDSTGMLQLWDLRAQKIGNPWSTGHDPIQSLEFSADNKKIVSGSSAGAIAISDVKNQVQITSNTDLNRGPITFVAFSHDGKHVVSGGDDKAVVLWNAETLDMLGDPMRRPGGLPGGPILGGIVSPDGRTVISASEDGTLRSWPTVTGWAEALCESSRQEPKSDQLRRWGARFLPNLPSIC